MRVPSARRGGTDAGGCGVAAAGHEGRRLALAVCSGGLSSRLRGGRRVEGMEVRLLGMLRTGREDECILVVAERGLMVGARAHSVDVLEVRLGRVSRRAEGGKKMISMLDL